MKIIRVSNMIVGFVVFLTAVIVSGLYLIIH